MLVKTAGIFIFGPAIFEYNTTIIPAINNFNRNELYTDDKKPAVDFAVSPLYKR